MVDAAPDQIVPTHSTSLGGSATDDRLPNPPSNGELEKPD